MGNRNRVRVEDFRLDNVLLHLIAYAMRGYQMHRVQQMASTKRNAIVTDSPEDRGGSAKGGVVLAVSSARLRGLEIRLEIDTIKPNLAGRFDPLCR